MYVYVISYDLMSPGQNYNRVISRLKELGAKQTLLSTWVLRHSASAIAIRDDLQKVVDTNDRLLIYASPSNWAAYNALNTKTIQQDIAA